MKSVFTLIIIVLVVSGVYNYFIKDSLAYITVDGDKVTVDVGDYVARFLVSGEFVETYMIFGGEHFRNKKLINPIWLSGLGIVDAKNIYARYPDFHRCSSAGSSLAKPKVADLHLVPADKRVFGELKMTIKEFEDNFANKSDRVCVSLVGKTLSMQSAKVPGENIDIKDHLPPQTFYLVHSSERVNCKNLLEQ